MTAVVLADRLPIVDERVRSAALVVGGALLTAAAAQITIHLPWTPVPITGQTFAVLLVGGALGWRRGAASMLLYVALGAIGLPFYAANPEGLRGGWALTTGPTAGYFVGFILAAALVGRMAERGQDRRLDTSITAMLGGTAIIYFCGVWWLAYSLDWSAEKAITGGMTPFVIGDLLKLLLAGAALPTAWRFANRT